MNDKPTLSSCRVEKRSGCGQVEEDLAENLLKAFSSASDQDVGNSKNEMPTSSENILLRFYECGRKEEAEYSEEKAGFFIDYIFIRN